VSELELLDAPVRQASSLSQVDHRPWPPPEEAWLQAQTWNDVVFVHSRADAGALRRLLPPELELELYDGSAWLGVVPLRVSSMRLRGLPPLPGISSFGQLNVRTYVTDGERPGVWFFSLRIANRLVVEAVKRFYRLPAVRARVAVSRGHAETEGFRATYAASGASFEAAEGTLEHFLVERYRLYTADGGRLYGAEVHHLPWRLRRGEGSVEENLLAPVPLLGEPHVLVAEREDALGWPLEAR
jgi:uncharacterized protein YqjF (DUF2071 family)